MKYVRVAGTGELPANTMIGVMVNGKDVLLANVDGSYYALSNTCTHAGGSLSRGILRNGIVTCPNHGAQFNVKTGEAVGETRTGSGRIRPGDGECYSVKVEGTDIFVGVP